MGWAKIELEFLPEQHDINEVMQFLAAHFRTDEGVPTANILLREVGTEPAPFTMSGTQQFYTGPTSVHGISLPYPCTQGDLDLAADQMLQFYSPPGGRVLKIQAIKDLRSISNLGLKEAKDAIDAAEWRKTTNTLGQTASKLGMTKGPGPHP